MIVDAIQEQLTYGVRGDRLMPKYNPKTLIRKQRSGRPPMTDRVNLFDKGGFYADMFAVVVKGEIHVSSDDWKIQLLQEKYGGDIFKISRNQWEAIYEEIEPEVKQDTNKWLNQ